MCISETGSSERNYYEYSIALVSVGIAVTGVFVTLAAFQVLPQGVNAISQLGALGQGLGYMLMGGGVALGAVLFSVRYYLQGQQESNALKRSQREDIKEEITFDTLFEHVHKNNLEELKRIHTQHPALFQSDREGFNLLHLAVREGKVEIVKWLYETHPNLQESRDNQGMTPFDKVRDCWDKEKKMEIIKYFLGKGCNVVEPPKEWGLFFSVITERNMPLITILLEARPQLAFTKDFLKNTAENTLKILSIRNREADDDKLDKEIYQLIEDAKTRFANSEKFRKL